MKSKWSNIINTEPWMKENCSGSQMEASPIPYNLIKSFTASRNKLATLWRWFVCKFPFYFSGKCVCFGPAFLGECFDFIRWTWIPPYDVLQKRHPWGMTDETVNPDTGFRVTQVKQEASGLIITHHSLNDNNSPS